MASFYGNITDTGRAYFQFDRIFASRRDMDEAAAAGADGIFPGRFVLVKYDPEENTFFSWDILQGYKKPNDENNYLYMDSTYTAPYRYAINFTQVNAADKNIENWQTYFYKNNDKYIPLTKREYYNENQEYWQIIGEDSLAIKTENIIPPNKYVAVYTYGEHDELISIDCYTYTIDGLENKQNYDIIDTWIPYTQNLQTEVSQSYIINFNKDAQTYGLNNNFDIRGYDATVWEKIYNNGKGQFIKVANLNGMVPSLEVIADAPSVLPQAPYLDAVSSDTHYRLHMPSNWGFKIKPVEINESTNTYDKSDVILENQPVAIYMNLGSNPYNGGENQQNYHRQEYHYDATTKNEIIYSYDGQSDKLYNGQHQNDTIQMSVNIPAIGNLLADGYDLIYGKNEPDPNNNNIASRPLDIDWYSGDTNEDIKKNGMPNKGGKTYDLKTLAGTINTAHDILGQIIVDIPSNNYPNEQDLGNMPRNYIYRYQDNYYRIDLITELIDLENNEYRYDPQPSVTNEDFAYNKYYIKQNNNFIPNTEPYNSTLENNGYYLRNINTIRYTPINLKKYEPNTYYYKNGENYYRDSSDPLPLYQENRTYYDITELTSKEFHAQYENNGTFFTRDENGNFIPSFTEIPEKDKYYKLDNAIRVRNFSNPQYFYWPNVYYSLDTTTQTFFLITDTIDNFNSQNYPGGFYILNFDTVPQYGLDGNGNVIQYYRVLSSTQLQTTPYQLNLNDLNNNKYYIIDENGTYVNYNNLIDYYGTINGLNPYCKPYIIWYVNPTEQNKEDLYLPGIYYILDADHNYIKSYENLNETIYYYTIEAEALEDPFYLPEKYWYEYETNHYYLDTSPIKTEGRIYYEKSALYVTYDEMNQCPYGFEWNDQASYVPPSITLGYSRQRLAFIKIPNIGGDGTNSLFGLLLSIHRTYAENDEITRNRKSIYGVFNQLKDMLYQVKNLTPRQLLFVNDFGQVESSGITIDQLKTLINNH